jgi:hypothetical protein
MIPMRHRTIFRSRWMALLWAAGIIWFALDFTAPDASATNGSDNAAVVDASGSPVTNEELAVLEQFVNGN